MIWVGLKNWLKMKNVSYFPNHMLICTLYIYEPQCASAIFFDQLKTSALYINHTLALANYGDELRRLLMYDYLKKTLLPTQDSFLDKKISLKKNQNRNNMLGKSPTLNA